MAGIHRCKPWRNHQRGIPVRRATDGSIWVEWSSDCALPLKAGILMSDKTMINQYLFYEFGYDLQHDPSAVTENWPFELRMVGAIHSAEGEVRVFEFVVDGEIYLALSGGALTFYPAAGMTLEDLQLQNDGAAWIACQDPVDLATSRIGDDLVPSAVERRAAVEELAAHVCTSPRVLEGLYLRAKGIFLALVEDTTTGTGIVVGSGLEPRVIAFPQASSWRRLALGVGLMLRDGILKS